MKYITYNKIDGSVAIATVVHGADIDEVVKKYKDVIDDVASYEVTDSPPDMPSDRIFRDAWTSSSKGKVTIDDSEAKKIHMGRIRRIRDEKLEKLDKEVLRNMSRADKLKEIETKKQVLREIPQTFDVSKMDVTRPERTWPAELELAEEYL